MDREPFVGAIVHVRRSGGCRPAIITRVWPQNRVNCVIWGDSGSPDEPVMRAIQGGRFDPGGSYRDDYCWHWPDADAS